MEIYKTKKEAENNRPEQKTEVMAYPCPNCGRKVFEAVDDRGCPYAGQGVCPYCNQKMVRTHFPAKERNIVLQYGEGAINMGSLADYVFGRK
ncbi:MAG: hypothetical protein JXQ83_06975 [Candidatus Glassbacteria bacterium]|nr:hypothetical protein [Candidatus Glassbacteria bacterium]